jgi:hypothetical protein
MDLMFSAVDHAMGSIGASGPMTPFVMLAAEGSVELHRFAADLVEEGVEQARAFIRAASPQATHVALAYDGYLTLDDVRTDAAFVAVQAAGTLISDLFAQRYEAGEHGVREIGNVKHVAVAEPSLLRAADIHATVHERGGQAAARDTPPRRGGLAPEPAAPRKRVRAFARLRGR